MNKTALIVGDFSAVGSNLVQAMRFEGYVVEIISDGDSYKKIDSVLTQSKLLKTSWGRFISLVCQVIKASFFSYDYVIFVTPFILKGPAWLCFCANKVLQWRGDRSIFLACGSDYYWWNYIPVSAKRTPHSGFEEDLFNRKHRFSKGLYGAVNKNLAKTVNKIIGLSPEYLACYRMAGYDVSYCGFPIFWIAGDQPGEESSRKIYCYHGVTRPGFKGTKQLLDLMKENKMWGYEALVTNRISSAEFVDNLKRSKIYLDQWSSFSPAMSALIAIQFCPVVISGIQKKYCDDIYFDKCPVLDPEDVRGDPDLVFTKLEDKAWKTKARSFLDRFHDPKLLVREIEDCQSG